MKRPVLAACLILSPAFHPGLAQDIPEGSVYESSWPYSEMHSAASSKGSQFDDIHLEWVEHFGLRNGPGIEVVTGMATNFFRRLVCITGYSSSPEGAFDFLTTCFDRDGDELWSARYDGPVGGEDRPIGVAVDIAGNTFVAGISQGYQTGYDFVAVKYDRSGNEQWTARYSNDSPTIEEFPLHAADYANDMVLLGDGGLVVTGRAADNYLTVKFDSTGQVVWRNFLDNKGARDEATALVADFEGNVYVTGSTSSSVTNFMTVKYDRDGKESWVTGFGTGDERAHAIDISYDGKDGLYVVGGRLSREFLLLKLETGEGNIETIIHPPGEGALTKVLVDADDNVYLTGYDDSVESIGGDYVTMKYDATGKLLWRAFFDGESHDSDIARDLFVTGDIVYVTGTSPSVDPNKTFEIVTVKYDGAGQQQWAEVYRGESTISDDAQAIGFINLFRQGVHMFVSGTSRQNDTGNDFTLIDYRLDSGSPDLSWVARRDGPGANTGLLRAMTVDAQGNIYIAGSTGLGDSTDCLTAKFDASGALQWSVEYDRAGRSDLASAIAVGIDGSVYVASNTHRPEPEITTLKYDPEGQLLWDVHHEILEQDEPEAVAEDGNGGVILAAIGGEIVKYGSDGSQQWVVDTGFLNTHAIELYGCCKIIAAGTFKENSESDIMTRSYDSNGAELWSARYDNPATSMAADFETAKDLAVDLHGNVYVTGRSNGVSTGEDIVTVKYDSTGQEIWTKRTDASFNDDPDDLALDGLGNVYVAGSLFDAGGDVSYDALTVKYDSEGNEQWMQTYGGELAGSHERARHIATDQVGNTYVAMTSGFTSAGFDRDIVIVKYSPEGAEESVLRYDRPTLDTPTGLHVDDNGGLVVGGNQAASVPDNFLSSNMVVLKYAQTPVTSVEDQVERLPNRFHLSQNYPNPFNPAGTGTTIEYQLPHSARVSLKVLNLLGQEAAVLMNGHLEAGKHAIHWDAAGMPASLYFYRLEADGYVATRSMAIQR